MHSSKKHYILIALLTLTFTMPAYEAEASMFSKLKKKVTQSVIKTLPKPLQKTATKLDAARNKGHAAVRGAHLKIANQKFDIYKDAAKFKQKVHIDGLKFKKQVAEHKSKTVRKMASDGAEHKFGVMQDLEKTHRQGVQTRAGIATVGALAPIAGHVAGGAVGTALGLGGIAGGTAAGAAVGTAGKPAPATVFFDDEPTVLPAQPIPSATGLQGATGVGEASTSAAPPVLPQKGEMAGKPDPNTVKGAEGEQEIASADTTKPDVLKGSEVVCVFKCGGRSHVEFNKH